MKKHLIIETCADCPHYAGADSLCWNDDTSQCVLDDPELKIPKWCPLPNVSQPKNPADREPCKEKPCGHKYGDPQCDKCKDRMACSY